MSWPLKTLDELGYVSRGRSRHRPRDAAHLYGGPYPFIQTSDVKHAGLFLNEYSQTYSDAGLAQSRIWPAGTLCITIAANIADTAILGIDACFPDSIIGFVPNPTEADARFVKYMFDAMMQRKFQQFTQGSAQDNLSQAKLLSLTFPTPSVSEQTRIASILSAYDDLIENNRRRMALLEQAARLLYREWFVHLRFPGHEHVAVVDGVPVGWERKTIGEVAQSVSYGLTASATREAVGPKFLRITDIVPEFIDWDQVPHCESDERKIERNRLEVGDVVVARTGATVGYAKLVSHLPSTAVYASYLVRFRFSDPKTGLIVGIYMESTSYKEFIRNHAGGAAQPNANAKVLGSASVVLPNQTLRDQFHESVTPLIEQRDLLTQQNHRLSSARDLLLPRLINGEVAV